MRCAAARNSLDALRPGKPRCRTLPHAHPSIGAGSARSGPPAAPADPQRDDARPPAPADLLVRPDWRAPTAWSDHHGAPAESLCVPVGPARAGMVAVATADRTQRVATGSHRL